MAATRQIVTNVRRQLHSGGKTSPIYHSEYLGTRLNPLGSTSPVNSEAETRLEQLKTPETLAIVETLAKIP